MPIPFPSENNKKHLRSQTQNKNELLLVDEHPELLYSWKERTRSTGMTFLRSAVGFHLDIPVKGLKTFASNYGYSYSSAKPTNSSNSNSNTRKLSKKARRQSKNNQHRSKHKRTISKNIGGVGAETNSEMLTVGRDYQRPALKLFNDHCDMVIDKYRLKQHHFRGRVESIDLCSNTNPNDDDANEHENENEHNTNGLPLRVVIRNTACNTAPAAASEEPRQTQTKTTTVSADNIVFAVGNDDPVVPEWAAHLVSVSEHSNSFNNNNNNRNNRSNRSGGVYHLLQLPNNRDSDTRDENAVSAVPFGEKEDTDVVDETNNNNNNCHRHRHRQRCVAIIGGGISAVHKALDLVSSDSNANFLVHIISRHELREQQFDTHQDWMMTKELAQRSLDHGGTGFTQRQKDFSNISDASERRQVIARERIPGTVPAYMTRASRKSKSKHTKGIDSLEGAIQEGYIRWHVAGVAGASIASKEHDEETASRNDGRHADTTAAANNGHEKNDEDDHHDGNRTFASWGVQTYTLLLTNGDSIGGVDEIILATGLGKKVPGHKIIHPLATMLDLPLSPCGYPLLDQSLLWKPRSHHRGASAETTTTRNTTIARTSTNIFVSGGLAEIELGPSARNIAGARMAAERIAAAGIQ
eukprot:jgi/Psemu1/326874/estExt_fgenesh1_pg.C_4830001